MSIPISVIVSFRRGTSDLIVRKTPVQYSSGLESQDLDLRGARSIPINFTITVWTRDAWPLHNSEVREGVIAAVLTPSIKLSINPRMTCGSLGTVDSSFHRIFSFRRGSKSTCSGYRSRPPRPRSTQFHEPLTWILWDLRLNRHIFMSP